MNKVIVILGPTNVGKTKLSVSLAKEFNGEVINADSMQFYKDLDIGTAKIKEEEKEGITNHLFDILDVCQNYSIYDYQIMGREVIDNCFKRRKTPIVVGGTGLYIKALLYDYKLSKSTINNTYDELSTKDIYNKLVQLDKNINIDKNNRPRLIRALNYYLENNSSISKNVTDKLLYDTIFIGLTSSRDILYNKINERVDKMIEEGLVDEVKSLYTYKDKSKALKNGIGYKEIISYLDNDISLDQAIQKIKQNSRRYAKRQMTFFRNKLNVKWFNTNYEDFNKTINEVIDYIRRVGL